MQHFISVSNAVNGREDRVDTFLTGEGSSNSKCRSFPFSPASRFQL